MNTNPKTEHEVRASMGRYFSRVHHDDSLPTSPNSPTTACASMASLGESCRRDLMSGVRTPSRAVYVATLTNYVRAHSTRAYTPGIPPHQQPRARPVNRAGYLFEPARGAPYTATRQTNIWAKWRQQGGDISNLVSTNKVPLREVPSGVVQGSIITTKTTGHAFLMTICTSRHE